MYRFICSKLYKIGIKIKPKNWKPVENEHVFYRNKKYVFIKKYEDEYRRECWCLGKLYDNKKTIVIYGNIRKEVYPR